MGLVDDLLVTSGGHHAPAVHDDNAVRPAHGAGPVGDDQDRTAPHQRRQGPLDLGLGLGVGHGRGLVEQEDGVVGQDRPGDGDALLLPARQRGLPPDDGVVPVGQGHNDVVDLGDAGGGAHLLQVRPRPPQGDVVTYRGAEELGVLEHEGDGVVQGLLLHLPQVHPADAHGPGVGVGEAGDEGGQGRLAGPGGAQEGGDRAGLQGQGDVVEGEGPPVGEADVVDLHAGRLGYAGAGGLGQDGDVEDLAQAQGRGPGHLVGPGDRGHGDNGAGQDQGDEGGDQDLGQGDRPGVQEQGAAAQVDQQDHRDGHPGEGQAADGDQRQGPGAVEGGEAVGGVQVGGVGAADPPEGLDHEDAGDELDHGGGDLGQTAVHLHRLLVHAPQGQGVGQDVEDHRDQGQQGQAPVDPEGVGQQRQRGDDGVEHLHRPVGDDGVHGGGVVLDRLAHPARGRGGEPGQGDVGQARHNVPAQVVPQAQVSQVGGQQGHEVEEEPRGVGADQHHDDVPDAVGVRGGAGVVGVEQDVAELGQGDVGGDGQDRGDHDQDLAHPQAGAYRGAQAPHGRLARDGLALVVRLGVRLGVFLGIRTGARLGVRRLGARLGGYPGARLGGAVGPGGACRGGAASLRGRPGVREGGVGPGSWLRPARHGRGVGVHGCLA